MNITAKSITAPPVFTPVVVAITCETQEELDALTCLSNAAWIGDAMREVFGRTSALQYAPLQNAGGDTGRTLELNDAIRKAFDR